MSSASSVYSAPLQPYHVRNMMKILRDANAHYTRIAERMRVNRVPTHHARSRAHKLGLTVNVAKAVACDHRHVSTIPLPIVEQSPLPVQPIASSTSYRLQAHLSPLVPAYLTKTTPNGTTSTFSSASVYSFITLTSAAISNFEDELDMDVEEEYTDEVQHHSMAPDVPIDATLVKWSIYDRALSGGISIKVGDASMFDFDDSPTSSPSTAYSSAGPMTPDEQVHEPVMLRIKRKSAEMTGFYLDEHQKQTKMLKVDEELTSDVDVCRNTIRIPARRV